MYNFHYNICSFIQYSTKSAVMAQTVTTESEQWATVRVVANWEGRKQEDFNKCKTHLLWNSFSNCFALTVACTSRDSYEVKRSHTTWDVVQRTIFKLDIKCHRKYHIAYIRGKLHSIKRFLVGCILNSIDWFRRYEEVLERQQVREPEELDSMEELELMEELVGELLEQQELQLLEHLQTREELWEQRELEEVLSNIIMAS